MENFSMPTWNETANFSSQRETSQLCVPFSSANSNTEKALMIVGYIIQFVLSIIGNALVIGVFCKWNSLQRTPVNSFIVNMAVSDLFVPLFVIPRRVQEVYLGWSPWLVHGVLGDILCKVVNFADEMSVTVSSQSMVFIAAERFLAIVYPLKGPLISRKNVPKFICFTWIFSALSYLFYFFAYNLVNKDDTIYCKYGLPEFFDTWEDLWKVDRMGLLAVFGVLPFILLTIFYTAIIIALYRQKTVAIQVPSAVEKRRAKEKQRIILMLVTLVLIFFIAWTPHYIFVFNHYYLYGANWSCKSRRTLYVTVKFINYIYTVVNPVIYYSFNKEYRRGFHKILCCPWSCIGHVLALCRPCLCRGCRQDRPSQQTVIPMSSQPSVICLNYTYKTD